MSHSAAIHGRMGTCTPFRLPYEAEAGLGPHALAQWRAMTLERLFGDHLAERQSRAEAALDELGFDSLVLSSGEPHTYFSDDQDAPFRSVPHFSHWCPLPGPHHVLQVRPGKRPLLIRFAPRGLLVRAPRAGRAVLGGRLRARRGSDRRRRVGAPRVAPERGLHRKRAPAGDRSGSRPEPRRSSSRGWTGSAPTSRSSSSSVSTTRPPSPRPDTAPRIAAFEEGGSELDDPLRLPLARCEVSEHELPYPTIIALDEKAAFLHYHEKRKAGDGRVLLIDAGAASEGYASDITRTHVRSDCDARFVALRRTVWTLFQRRLCDAVRPGIPYGDLHHRAHLEIAALLSESGLVRGQVPSRSSGTG